MSAAPDSNSRAAVLSQLRSGIDIGEGALARARQLAEATGVPTEQALNRLGIVSDIALAEAYAQTLKLDIWNPAQAPPDLNGEPGRASGDFLRRHNVLPLKLADGALWIAASDPLAEEAFEGLRFAFGTDVRVLVAKVGELKEALDTHHKAPEPIAPLQAERGLRGDVDLIEDESLNSDAVAIVTRAVGAAIRKRASDIHIEPRRYDLQMRLRVDGELIPYKIIERRHAEAVIARLKVLSELDLGERRLPQDGRATIVFEGRPVELRVSIVPTVHGESAVLRLLDRSEMAAKLDALGLSASTHALLARAAHGSNGVFLISGPTGSGKTTTLYAMLNELKSSTKKILSVEDPVEYRFDHVIQVQAAPRIGLTFASALRSFLRQDPDVMLIGEIRDAETAEIAFQAAMTGHLVLASIHANDAARVVSRLKDLSLPPYQIAAALMGASAQRLVRRLCVACRHEAKLSQEEAAWCAEHGIKIARAFSADGCPVCDQVGYFGRTVLSETFACTADVRALIGADAPLDQVETAARKQGMVTMLSDACQRVEAGETSLAEIRRALST